MNVRSSTVATAFALATLLAPLAPQTASADALYSGTVTGFFSSPVTSGTVIGVNNVGTYYNNSATAVTSGFPGSYITWGANPAYSQLLFLGDSFTDVAPDQIFHLGTIIYQNSTSALESLIFGAELHLLTGVSDEHISRLKIVTTANTGLSAARDSDFIGFSDFSSTFNVYEDQVASIELFGSIVGDPMLTIDHIAISPVTADAGFIGNGVADVPEPASWLLLLIGFFGLGAGLRASRARGRAVLAG